MASSEAQPSTYQLWKRFSLPVEGGTKDSVAVKAGTGTNLVAAYTLLVKLIVTQLWALAVLGGMIYSKKISKRSKMEEKSAMEDGSKKEAEQKREGNVSIGVISASIFISKSSPPTVLKLTMKYFIRAKELHHRYFSLAWMVGAAIFLSLGYSLPIILTRYLIVGHAAPVAPEAIYVPDDLVTGALAYQMRSLKVPSALRAAGAVNASSTERVTLDGPNISLDHDGNQVVQLGYSYNISGVELGLQHAPDLFLSVQGSCVTDYSWFRYENITNETSNGLILNQITTDFYSPWNNKTLLLQFPDYNVALPFVSFVGSPENNSKNQSFGMIISSLKRRSFRQGHDPWYLTTDTPVPDPSSPNSTTYAVLGGRPALSCWEAKIWSYQGHTADPSELDSIPGLSAPRNALGSAFGSPLLLQIGQRLDKRALRCANSAFSHLLDAANCSIQNDLTYLIFTSYVASKTALSDITTYGPEQPGIRNTAKDDSGTLRPGAADFVIYSNDVAALSIKVIIIIPTIVCGLVLLVTFMTYKFGIKPAYKRSMAEYWAKWVDPM